MAKVATDFEKIIQEGRERKKNELLADKIFSKNRRQSAPSKLKASAGPSLASRVGVKKQRNSSIGIRPNPPAGNVNGEWTHDLHNTVANGDKKRNSLSARITAPGTHTDRRAAKRNAKLAAAVDRLQSSVNAPQQVNIKPAPMGLTIRGLAGPFVVMAQNFAPGTTAADIESAMTPVGGEMASCKVIKTNPFIVVEMAFVSREGGEQVIATFNDKTADGRVIKVYPKIGGTQSPSIAERSDAPINAPNGPRASRARRNDNIVDGSMGFPNNSDKSASNTSRNNDRLYSDSLVSGNRRNRGGPRGRGGAGR